MLDLNTVRRIQQLAPANYMDSYSGINDPASNPMSGLNSSQSDALSSLLAQAQQQGVQSPPIDKQAPQVDVPQTYQGYPITGMMQPPQSPAQVVQARVPDVSMNAGGLRPDVAAATPQTGMPPARPFPYQYLGPGGGASSSETAGSGTPNIDPKQLQGLMPSSPAMAGFENLMAPGNTPAYDEYIRQLQNPPNEANYRPSKLRTAMAALAGLGGNPAMTDYIQHMPYERAKADYEGRLKQLQGGATEEEKMISNKRGLLTAQAMDEIRGQQANLNAQKLQFGMDAKDRELQEKTREFNTNQQRLMFQLQQAEGDKQRTAQIQAALAKAREDQMTFMQTWYRGRLHDQDMRVADYGRNIDSMIAERDKREGRLQQQLDLHKQMADDLRNGRDTTQYYYDSNGDLQLKKVTSVGPKIGAGGHTRQQAQDWLKSHGQNANDENMIQNMLKEQNWPK